MIILPRNIKALLSALSEAYSDDRNGSETNAVRIRSVEGGIEYGINTLYGRSSKLDIVLTQPSDLNKGQSSIDVFMADLEKMTKKLPASVKTLSLDHDGPNVLIEGGKTRYRATPPDYERLDDLEVEENYGFSISAETLEDMLSRAQHAISKDGTRQYLHGINISHDPDVDSLIRTVATDGHRLNMSRSKVAFFGDKADWKNHTIPTKAVGAILSALKVQGAKGDAKIAYDGAGFFSLSVPEAGILIKGGVMDNHYPDFSRVLPEGPFDIELTIDKKELLETLKVTAALSNENVTDSKKTIGQVLAPGSLTVIGQGGNPSTSIPKDKFSLTMTEKNDQELPVTFGARNKYLVDAAGVMDGEKLHWRGNYSKKPYLEGPSLFSCETAWGDSIEVVMPCRM